MIYISFEISPGSLIYINVLQHVLCNMLTCDELFSMHQDEI